MDIAPGRPALHSFSIQSDMPRSPIQSPLPALKKILPSFARLKTGRGKLDQVVVLLRKVAVKHRTSHNQTFHSTREIGRFFGVSQQTANFAVAALEKEGLLRRVRGAKTLLLGSHVIARSSIRAIAGFPIESIETHYSYTHTRLSREIGDLLWPHNIVVDLITYFDKAVSGPTLDERLHRHGIDFCIWVMPPPHRRETILRLQDRGVRNLVVNLDISESRIQSDIIIEVIEAYRQTLLHWKRRHGIKTVRVVESALLPRKRIHAFVRLARELGMKCDVETCTPSLVGELHERYRDTATVGVVLLDEHAVAEFVFYDPESFVKLARRHRILFGNNYVNIPFAGHGELNIDRIILAAEKLLEAITGTLVRWRDGDFEGKPPRLRADTHFDALLWRYL